MAQCGACIPRGEGTPPTGRVQARGGWRHSIPYLASRIPHLASRIPHPASRLAHAYSTGMRVAAVVQQSCERSLEPEGCVARTICEQLPGTRVRREKDLAVRSRSRHGSSRHGFTHASRYDVCGESGGRGERAIQLNESSKGSKSNECYKRFAAGLSAMSQLP